MLKKLHVLLCFAIPSFFVQFCKWLCNDIQINSQVWLLLYIDFFCQLHIIPGWLEHIFRLIYIQLIQGWFSLRTFDFNLCREYHVFIDFNLLLSAFRDQYKWFLLLSFRFIFIFLFSFGVLWTCLDCGVLL